jgi:hypothetical protein
MQRTWDLMQVWRHFASISSSHYSASVLINTLLLQIPPLKQILEEKKRQSCKELPSIVFCAQDWIRTFFFNSLFVSLLGYKIASNHPSTGSTFVRQSPRSARRSSIERRRVFLFLDFDGRSRLFYRTALN